MECEAGFFLDQLAQTCAAAPPQPCTGTCTDGYCSDPLDCNRYVRCDGGKFLSSHTCDDATDKYFDNTDAPPTLCVADKSKCDPRTVCVHATTATTSTTTTTTTTTTSTANPDSQSTTTTSPGTEAVTPPPPSACSSSTAYQIWPDPEDCKG